MDLWDAAERQELDALRRRAWGKGATGALTAPEQQRLAELERQTQRRVQAPVSRAPAVDTQDSPGGASLDPGATWTNAAPTLATHGEASAVVGEDASSAQTSAPDQNRAAASWIRRVPPWLVASLALVVGVALGLVAPAVFDGVPDARLAVVEAKDPSDLDPQYVDYFTFAWASPPDTVQVHQEYRSAQVFSGLNEAGLPCLAVIFPESFSSPSCAAHGHPVVDVVVWEDSSQYFDGEFPVGTVVRFELRGDAVDVWVAEAPGDAPTPDQASRSGG